MWLILAESDGLSDHADGLGSDAEALGFAACYQRDARTRRGLARQDAPQCRDNAAATTHSVRGLWRVSKKHEVKDQRMGEACEQGKYRKYEKRRKKSTGNVIFVVSLQPVPWYIKNNPPTLIVAGIRKLGYVL